MHRITSFFIVYLLTNRCHPPGSRLISGLLVSRNSYVWTAYRQVSNLPGNLYIFTFFSINDLFTLGRTQRERTRKALGDIVPVVENLCKSVPVSFCTLPIRFFSFFLWQPSFHWIRPNEDLQHNSQGNWYDWISSQGP